MTRYVPEAMYTGTLERAEAAEGELRELRENVLLGLGMAAEDVAEMDDALMEPSIRFLLSGYQEALDELATLRAQLAARDHAACPHCGQSLRDVQLLPF